MNSTVPKSGNAATPAAASAPAATTTTTAASKPVVARKTTAATPTRTGTATARTGRPPAVKKAAPATAAAVKKALARPPVKKTVTKTAVPVAKRLALTNPVAAAKEKGKKSKLVRDSFTMPEAEYAVLGEVKKTALKAGISIKKSDLFRIGVALVSQLGVGQLQTALAGLTPLKAGRPKKGK